MSFSRFADQIIYLRYPVFQTCDNLGNPKALNDNLAAPWTPDAAPGPRASGRARLKDRRSVRPTIQEANR